MKKIRFIIIMIFCWLSPISFATSTEVGPWSVLFYTAGTAKQTFGNVLLGKYTAVGEDLYTAELAYTFAESNLIRRFFHLIADTTQIATNYTYRHDYKHADNVNEGNLYLVLRWTYWPEILGKKIEFPWHNYLVTTFAFGDGISYASHPPYADRIEGMPAKEFNRLLNYLMLEATFAMPTYPNLQLVGRLHHRCTAWGTFPKNINAGSTSIGIGIRFIF